MTDEVTVEIEALGPRGDGIAKNPGGRERGRLYIAGALPGEQVRVRPGNKRGDGLEAKLLEIVTPSNDRTAPPCRHFATCGGCSVQHLALDAYHAWKRELVTNAIQRVGFDPELVAPLIATKNAGRRRATFAAFRPRARDSKTFFGFHTRASRHVVELEECLILHPELMALVPKLREVLADIVPPGARWDVSVTLADNGFDVLIVAAHEPGPDASMALAMFADAQGLARVAWQLEGTGRDEIEPVALHRTPVLELSGVPVEIPPGVFLQASAEAEKVLSALVVEASQGSRVADLYCGVGTFALPLAAAGAKVMAVDGDSAAIAALARAAGTAGFGGQVMAAQRDLVRQPMAAAEFRRIETIVFDPPRAGAAAQAEEIAQTDAARVVAVSCNPMTFARDALTLTEGGYTLERITPVDQFVWSGHVELVAVFSR
ncbi:MAG: class I SAM-dependent RNA methyltransferase [Rhodospirillaceae bacterium]|jgi:23S rRNA (uracil1939-C5)-methyltransferase|nr:class I SAM-dependent RNA methyltransferase [Rhodospirillaceae bacterium]MBT6403527.1 class I SAM-dependent RNA methyltransferase [Rhodospirillaceae bacterium]MBT6536281.1 class I SAM-dependent RNA methyltransferase [Rhodospirillaceae bacterium]